MLKDSLIILLLFFYFIIFIFWLIWFQNVLRKGTNKKNIYLFNIIGLSLPHMLLVFLFYEFSPNLRFMI